MMMIPPYILYREEREGVSSFFFVFQTTGRNVCSKITSLHIYMLYYILRYIYIYIYMYDE